MGTRDERIADLEAINDALVDTLEFIGRAFDRMIDAPERPHLSDVRELNTSVRAAIKKAVA